MLSENEQQKLATFQELFARRANHGLALLKAFLIECNPGVETVAEMKEMIENGNIISEIEMHKFLDKWLEYLEMRDKALDKKKLDEEFTAIMRKSFGGK